MFQFYDFKMDYLKCHWSRDLRLASWCWLAAQIFSQVIRLWWFFPIHLPCLYQKWAESHQRGRWNQICSWHSLRWCPHQDVRFVVHGLPDLGRMPTRVTLFFSKYYAIINIILFLNSPKLLRKKFFKKIFHLFLKNSFKNFIEFFLLKNLSEFWRNKCFMTKLPFRSKVLQHRKRHHREAFCEPWSQSRNLSSKRHPGLGQL